MIEKYKIIKSKEKTNDDDKEKNLIIPETIEEQNDTKNKLRKIFLKNDSILNYFFYFCK